MAKKFIDNVLLEMYRQYSESEVVATFKKRVSDLQIEKGILLSEIEELKDKFQLEKDMLLSKIEKLENESKIYIDDREKLEGIVKEHYLFRELKKVSEKRKDEIFELKIKNKKYADIIYQLAEKLNENNIEWQSLTWKIDD